DGQRREHEVVNLHVGLLHAPDEVLANVAGPGDDVGLHVQPEARHAHGVAYALLPVDRVGAWDDVEGVAARGDGYGARGLDRPDYVLLADDAVRVGHGHKPRVVIRGAWFTETDHEAGGVGHPRRPFAALSRWSTGPP